MKKAISVLLVLVMSLSLCACSSGTAGVGAGSVSSSVVIEDKAYTIEEFADIASNNSYKFSQYVGKVAVVTGKITEIQTDWVSSNLGHSFDVSITIDGKWVFEVSRNNSMLNEIDLNDVVVVTGTISTELYGVVYSFGNATIRKIK